MSIATLPVKLAPGACLPKRAHWTDAGLDLSITRSVPIKPRDTVICGTGVSVNIPEGYVGLVVARSSLSRRGLILANGTGVIDTGYTGEIMLPLLNVGDKVALPMDGERLAQLLIVPVALPEAVEVDELGETERGADGFGSTGL